ncbi:MAG: Methionine adenosyltransferase [Parcubacteria group bacterium GW2011_GWA1_36_12]|uniref:Methionine adenosyltransferase n=1 Tax=Candidatus Daviesbacteria bacterium GW2011_GWB1_41_5 TaxID=1618429 RepID=A0A0G0WM79_9BACT|nr:MAG: Methionine adenosyltransferase [Parcubacteria group bacterium GW2011_GWA1_36_12]KKS13869.1 MAG: Methionine adenosyltransferase [Candidatus Daviesbacteria bacterium GW2011_GWB1_41_5]
MNLVISKKDFNDLSYEFVERKGIGHPDTLSDALAEYLSAKYSLYTKSNFGVILHHNFDKVGLLGGAAEVGFGQGKLVKPIRVLLNGRASTRFGDSEINVNNLLVQWSREFFAEKLPQLNLDTDLEFHHNLSTQSSPGKLSEEINERNSSRKYWFEPRGIQDIPELKKLFSNDTSMGVGFFPFTKLEFLVLSIEETLNSKEFKSKYSWIGSDIKIMGFRHENTYEITLCVPQVANEVHSIVEYKNNLEIARTKISEILKKFEIDNYHLNINTRDNYDTEEVYLTATGSSIESGDEGLVGRGNRIQGFISPMRLISMEGVAGKNPVYHIGKLYYVAAQKISEKIYKKFGIQNETVLVSQSGRDLIDPWIVFVHIPQKFTKNDELQSFINEEVNNIPLLTEEFINLKVRIC